MAFSVFIRDYLQEKYGEFDESELKQQLINKYVDLFKKMDVFQILILNIT